MKKLCPDLNSLADAALREFWQSHRPEQLKRLGDRLLAESLPKIQPRDQSFYPADLSQRRVALNVSVEEMSKRLGVTPAILIAWETGSVRPPASLGLIYALK